MCLYDENNVVISKVHYGVHFLKNSSIFLCVIPIDVYYNMVNLKFKIINVKYDFTWYFCVVVHKNYNCDN